MELLTHISGPWYLSIMNVIELDGIVVTCLRLDVFIGDTHPPQDNLGLVKGKNLSNGSHLIRIIIIEIQIVGIVLTEEARLRSNKLEDCS